MMNGKSVPQIFSNLLIGFCFIIFFVVLAATIVRYRYHINSEIINIMHNENIAEPAVCKMLEDINEYQMLITEILKERRKKDDDK